MPRTKISISKLGRLWNYLMSERSRTFKQKTTFYRTLGVDALETRDVPSTLVYGRDFEPNTSATYAPGVSAAWSNTNKSTSPSGDTFLGSFSNSAVTLTLNNLPSHDGLFIDFDLYLLRSWDGNDSQYGQDKWSFAINGETIVDASFRNPRTVSNPTESQNQSYSLSTPLGGGQFESGTGAIEINTLGYTFTNSQGAQSMDSIYHFSFPIEHNASSITLVFTGSGLQGISDESWGIDNVAVAAGALPIVSVEKLSDAAEWDESEEGPKTGYFRFTRSGDTSQPLTVFYSVIGSASSATPGEDYDTLSSVVTFNPGADFVDVAIQPHQDNTVEDPDETITVAIDSDHVVAPLIPHYLPSTTSTKQSATAKIIDDPRVMQIEFYGTNMNKVNNLSVAKWENSFGYSNGSYYVKEPDASNRDAIDLMKEGFYVYVFDKLSYNNNVQSIQISLSTASSGDDVPYNDAGTTLILYPDSNRAGWYKTDSQILVSNKVDDVYSNEAAQIGSDEQLPNLNKLGKIKADGYAWPLQDRTHIISLGGTVIASYAPNAVQGVVRDPINATMAANPLAHVKIHVTVLNASDGNGGFTPLQSTSNVFGDILRANELLAQLGIKVDLVGQIQVANQPAGVDLSNGLDDQGETISGGKISLSPEERSLVSDSALRQNGAINVYYANYLTSTALGSTRPTQYMSDTSISFGDNIFMGLLESSAVGPGRIDEVLGHEIIHALEIRNLFDPAYPGVTFEHYPYGPTMFGNDIEYLNLMNSGPRLMQRDSVFDSVRTTTDQQNHIIFDRQDLLDYTAEGLEVLG